MTGVPLSLTHRPYLIGIAGGTASGKTTMTNTIVRTVGPRRVTVISYDAYYKDLSHLPLADRLHTNLDHPDALDTGLLIQHLTQLRSGQPAAVPLYDFATCVRQPGSQHVAPTDVIIVDGILTLAEARLREMFDLKIFVDLSADERILRRLERDLIERGRTVRSVVDQYRETVRPMHDQFVEPSKKYADFIVPGDAARSEALETVAAQVRARILIARLDTLEQLGGHLLSDALDHEVPLLHEIARVAAGELTADSITLHQFDSHGAAFRDPDEFSVTWPLGGHLAWPRTDGLSAYVVAHGALAVPDVAADPWSGLTQTRHLVETGTRAFLGVRLRVVDETVGVLFFNYRRPRPFGPDETAIANILGVYAATAIQRSRLYDRVYARFHALEDVTEMLSTTEPAALKACIVRAAAHTLNADDVTLHQYAASFGRFLPAASHSATWPEGGQLAPPRTDGVSAYVIKHGTVVVANVDTDLSEDLRQTAHLHARGTHAFLGLRLQAGAEKLGVLFVNYHAPRSFDPYERAVAQVFGLYAAAALLAARHTPPASVISDNDL